jgi:uncharacterized protein YyaL (SSP411 family)
MDEGAFSDRENMALLNAYFIALRIENAKRPDIDARYNLNGWPTIAFVTPDGKLLAAANFLSGDDFKELLLNVYMDYEKHKNEVQLADVNQLNNSAAADKIGRDTPRASSVGEITSMILRIADRVNGGYGSGQKFIHSEANDFLLSRYEATQDVTYLDHVCLTLDRMRASPIYDQQEGGFFRTTTGADWSQPHREKLLAEQAGLLSNCLRLLDLTGRAEYGRMAEEIIDYLDRKLFDATKPAFLGCEDFLRREAPEGTSANEFFTILDDCVYTDANALAIGAYLEAAKMLGRPDRKRIALNVLEFLWSRCWNEGEGVYHYFDTAPRVPGLLIDQARMGVALIHAYRATSDRNFIERAKKLAGFILTHLTNPDGGYYDCGHSELSIFGSRLTLIDQNGIAASFFLMLADTSKDMRYREAALWALGAFTKDFASAAIHAAPFGRALGEFLGLPAIDPPRAKP